MDMSNTRRIVVLGKTGAGKSSLANTIFGEKLFRIDHSPNSETSKCKAKTKAVNGRSITLIDTPGFFDTEKSEEELKPEIVRCITECAPGPHAFLIVLKVEKFTEQEHDIINKIQQYFSEEVFKYATVLFTHGDQLPEGQTIEDFVRKNERVSDLVKKCGGRCHVVDNKYWNEKPKDEYRSNQFQVEKLLNTIDKTLQANKGSYYTNEMLQAVEEEIQREDKRIRLLPTNMSEKEIREQAKGAVFNKLLIRLAGTATGALLGALFGVVVMVAIVVTVLKKIKPIATTVRGTAAGGTAAGGTAAGGTAAGGTAAGGTAAAGATTGTAAVLGVSAAVGAVVGGFTGYCEAEGADTPREAAQRAAGIVKDGALFVIEEVKDVLDNVFQSKSKQS